MSKKSFDYFPFDVRLNDKMKLIEAEYGLNGFAVVVKIWMKIYSNQGYYCEWDEEVALLFSRENGVGGNAVSEILNSALKRGIFDKTLYEKYGILTSSGIQKRVLEMSKRRQRFEIDEKYLLISVPEEYKNVYIKSENVYINPTNANIEKQSKVNKSKANKSKVNKSKAYTDFDKSDTSIITKSKDDNAKPIKHKYGEYKNVLLSDEELLKLEEKFPNDWEKRIETLSTGIELKGYKYKNHYLAILKWAKNDYEWTKNDYENKLKKQVIDYNDPNRYTPENAGWK